MSAPRLYEFDRTADPDRKRRVALAPGLQSGDLADLGLLRPQPARLRPFAAQPLVRRVLRRRDALGTEAFAVDRADRRLGARATTVSWKSRPPRRPMRTSSPNGAPRRAWPPPPPSRSPSGSSGAGRRHRDRRSRPASRRDAARSATISASRSRWLETCSPTRRKRRRRARTFKRLRAKSSLSGFFPIKIGVRCASFSILTQDRKPIQSCV